MSCDCLTAVTRSNHLVPDIPCKLFLQDFPTLWTGTEENIKFLNHPEECYYLRAALRSITATKIQTVTCRRRASTVLPRYHVASLPVRRCEFLTYCCRCRNPDLCSRSNHSTASMHSELTCIHECHKTFLNFEDTNGVSYSRNG